VTADPSYGSVLSFPSYQCVLDVLLDTRTGWEASA